MLKNHLTFMNNFTKMDTKINEGVLLRHGIAFEEDALITTINSDDMKGTDILGRNVVLAFRLSSFEHLFPNISIHGDLVSDGLKYYDSLKKLDLTDEQIAKIFKGQKYQTDNLYQLDISNSYKKHKNEPLKEKLESLINDLEKPEITEKKRKDYSFYERLDNLLLAGPVWAKNIYAKDKEGTIELFEAVKKSYDMIKDCNIQ